MLFSNVNGVPLADPRFFPPYELANDLETVLYIHPTHPADVQAMTEYWLMPLVGFLVRHYARGGTSGFHWRAGTISQDQMGTRSFGGRHSLSCGKT